MSAVASFIAGRGHNVIGSDRLFDRNPDNSLCEILKAGGITIVRQDGSGINNSFDFAVFSTAVEDGQSEVIRARELGIAVKTRPQYLCEIVAEFRTVAVTGTSGKSTTAGMLAFLMDKLRLRPNFIGGARVKQFKAKDNPGNFLNGSSNLLVVEACESDGSIIHYHPAYSVITNLSLDHNPIGKTAEMFEVLGSNTKEMVIVNGDDSNLRRCNFDKPKRFSIDERSEYRAVSIEYQPFKTTFGIRNVNFTVSLPGKYNLYNALSCIALLSEMGVELKDIAEVLPAFSGLDRRFNVYLNNRRYLVIDDYAHNPHKISCLMESIKRIRQKVCYIFQPHGFGPTRMMKQEYIEVFTENLRKEDHLILLPIYYAGGTSLRDISSEDLLNEINTAGKSVEVLHKRSLLFNRLKEWNNYVIFGARDETLADFARQISMRLEGEEEISDLY